MFAKRKVWSTEIGTVCIDTEFLDEEASKLHVLMVTLSVESKEMSCANLSWLVLILGATAA